MPVWKLSNAHKKNVEERSIWTKNGVMICRTEWFRWGSWTVKMDSKPTIDLENPNGYDVYGSGIEWDLDSMDDGDFAEWEFPDEMDDDERSRIEELYEEDGFSGLEDDGWDNTDTEVFIHGPLELTSDTD